MDYTGTGKEAFFSFVFGAIIAVGIVSAFLMLIKGNGVAGAGIEGIREIRWQRLTISLPLMFLLGSVVYRKRSHLLRRTWIDGQRFELSGHAWSYAWQHFWTAFLIPLTAGIAAPWRASRLEARKIAEMRHGAFAFKAAPDLRALYKAYALLWFGGGLIYVAMLVILARHIGPELLAAAHGLTMKPLLSRHVAEQGLSIAALGLIPVGLLLLTYKKAWLEHQISSIAFPTGQLRLKMPVLRYLALSLSNMALNFGSLGALAPVADARYLRFVIDHVTVEGQLDLSQPRS
jgi:uncharacterized membrane protein YjgN (DUF898 family)